MYQRYQLLWELQSNGVYYPLHAKVLVCQRELEMQILWLSLNHRLALQSNKEEEERKGGSSSNYECIGTLNQ